MNPNTTTPPLLVHQAGETIIQLSCYLELLIYVAAIASKRTHLIHVRLWLKLMPGNKFCASWEGVCPAWEEATSARSVGPNPNVQDYGARHHFSISWQSFAVQTHPSDAPPSSETSVHPVPAAGSQLTPSFRPMRPSSLLHLPHPWTLMQTRPCCCKLLKLLSTILLWLNLPQKVRMSLNARVTNWIKNALSFKLEDS